MRACACLTLKYIAVLKRVGREQLISKRQLAYTIRMHVVSDIDFTRTNGLYNIHDDDSGARVSCRSVVVHFSLIGPERTPV